MSLVIDITIIALLAAAIVYAVILNKRLSVLRSGEAEMKVVVTELGAAIAKAESNLARMHSLSEEFPKDLGSDGVAGELKNLVSTARSLSDDLSFLVVRAEQVADRMVETGQKPAPTSNDAEASPQPEQSEIERELFEALRAAR